MSRDRMDDVFWALRCGLGITAVASGADKFTNLLTHWRKYLAPEIEDRLPVHGETYMKAVGVIEVAVGVGVLTGQKWAPWVAAGWLTCIAADLVINGDHDIAVRDLNMAIGAFALGRMQQQRHRELSHDQQILTDAHPQVA
jgi:uncharacterized membrane protein YphA (DoxX/SURF4 family)